MEKSIALYRGTFEDLGLTVTEDGKLLTSSGKTVKMDEREVVLPLERYLLKNEWSELFPWHPISENDVLGPSLPVTRYSAYLKVTTHVYLVKILETLIKLVQQPELQERLAGTRLIRILSELPKVSEKQIDDVRKALKRYLAHLNKNKISPITIRLSRIKGGKTEDGIRATRKVTVLTNYMEVDDPASYHEHCNTLSIAAKSFMDRLFEITDLSSIVFGDGTAPYYQGLLKVHKAIVEKLKPYLEEVACITDDVHVPQGDWFREIDNLKELSLEIVSLPGNEGVPMENINRESAFDPLDEVDEPKRKPRVQPEPTYEPTTRKPSAPSHDRVTERTTEVEEPRRKVRGEVDLDVMDHIRFLDSGGRSGGDPYLDGRRDDRAPRDRYVDDSRDDRRGDSRDSRDRYHETDREYEDRMYYEEQDRRDREDRDRNSRYREEPRREERRYPDDRYRDDHQGGRYQARDPYVDERRDDRDDGRGRGRGRGRG